MDHICLFFSPVVMLLTNNIDLLNKSKKEKMRWIGWLWNWVGFSVSGLLKVWKLDMSGLKLVQDITEQSCMVPYNNSNKARTSRIIIIPHIEIPNTVFLCRLFVTGFCSPTWRNKKLHSFLLLRVIPLKSFVEWAQIKLTHALLRY